MVGDLMKANCRIYYRRIAAGEKEPMQMQATRPVVETVFRKLARIMQGKEADAA
jgi:hypothetical protein